MSSINRAVVNTPYFGKSTPSSHLILQGLTQHLEVGLPEFGKLIEKESAPMAEAYLPRTGPMPAPD